MATNTVASTENNPAKQNSNQQDIQSLLDPLRPTDALKPFLYMNLPPSARGRSKASFRNLRSERWNSAALVCVYGKRRRWCCLWGLRARGRSSHENKIALGAAVCV